MGIKEPEMEKKVKIIIDLLMTIGMFFLMGMRLTGQMWHEIAGTAVFLLFIIHHILNRKWIRAVPKGKYNAYRVFQTVINSLLGIGVLLLMLSGMAMSGYIFKWLPLPLSAGTARSIHLIVSHAVYLVMSMHIGLHFAAMIAGAGRRIQAMRKPWRGILTGFLRVLAVGVAAYGVLALLNRKFFSYIFGKVSYAYVDYDEPILWFFLDYAAIMGLCIFVTHYVAKFLRPGLRNRFAGIAAGYKEHTVKSVILTVVILAACTAAVIYGGRYIKRHYVPVEMNRSKAIGTETVDMGGRRGIVISFTRVGNTDFAPDVDAVSGASLMEENGQLIGNAGLLGDMVQQITGFDRFGITVEKKYSSSYGDTISEARAEMNSGFVPTFTGELPDLSEYDTGVLVFPLWWWTMPVPVKEYVKQADLSGKTIYCLVTHGGSGFGSSIGDLKEITSGTVSDQKLEIMDQDVTDAYPKVLEWIRSW